MRRVSFVSGIPQFVRKDGPTGECLDFEATLTTVLKNGDHVFVTTSVSGGSERRYSPCVSLCRCVVVQLTNARFVAVPARRVIYGTGPSSVFHAARSVFVNGLGFPQRNEQAHPRKNVAGAARRTSVAVRGLRSTAYIRKM